METLAGKLRIAILGNLHDLVDKVIDLNSVAAVKQYVRDLENGLEKLGISIAEQDGALKTLQRTAESKSARIEELSENIDRILSDGNPDNDNLAVGWQQNLNRMKAELASLRQELEAAQSADDALKQTEQALRSKKDAMNAQIEHLESMDRVTKAREAAAASVQAAIQIGTSAGVGVSVDDVAHRMQQRSDVAEAKLQQAMGNLSGMAGTDESLEMAKLDIEARKQRLAAQNAAPVSGNESATGHLEQH